MSSIESSPRASNRKNVREELQREAEIIKQTEEDLSKFLRTGIGTNVPEYLAVVLDIYPLKKETHLDTYFQLGMAHVIEHLKALRSR